MNQNKIVAFLVASIVAISIVAIAMPALGSEDKVNVEEKHEVMIDKPPGPESEPKKPEEPDEIEPEVREPDPRFNPVFRDAVIVYFNEMPASLDEFVSKYGVKLIFVKEDIKMAAFEISQHTRDFVEEVAKDSRVEKAYKDGFMFVRPDKGYTTEPEIVYPEDFDEQDVEYIPDEVTVGFWRLPPSLDEFASQYGATLKYVEGGLLFAGFETDDVTGFIKKIATDPYVRHAHPDPIGHICDTPSNPKKIATDPYVLPAEPDNTGYIGYTPNDPRWNQQWGPEKMSQRKYIIQKHGNTGKAARVSWTMSVVHKKIPAVKVVNISVRRGGALYKYPQKIGGNMKK